MELGQGGALAGGGWKGVGTGKEPILELTGKIWDWKGARRAGNE